MRLWVISSSYPTAPHESVNAGVLARDLALSLSRRGHEVHVITPTKPGGVTFDPELRGVAFSWYKPTREISDIGRTPVDVIRAASLMASGLSTVSRLARRTPPDAIIGLWGLPSGLLARRAAQAAQADYGVWLLGSDVWRADELPMGRRLLTSACRDAAVVAADGKSLADAAARITGVEVEYLPSSRRLPRPAGQSFPMVDVAFIGRYHRNKGPDILLQALATLQAERGISAEFYGAGGLENALREQAGRLKKVAVNNPIDGSRVRSRLQSCRVLVIPSRVESVPLILGDAIQARCLVVVSDVGDMADIVRRFGIGRVAEANDPVSLAKAIQSVIESRNEPDWSGAEAFLGPERPADYFLEHLSPPTGPT